jgi:hypothetical protein
MLFPFTSLRGEARDLNPRLAESIRLNGLREPIVIDKRGAIVGGNRRYRAIAHLRMTDSICWDANAQEWEPASERFLLVEVRMLDCIATPFRLVPFP